MIGSMRVIIYTILREGSDLDIDTHRASFRGAPRRGLGIVASKSRPRKIGTTL